MSDTALGIVFRPQRPPEELLATAEAADRAGLDELWLWEDCFEEAGIASAAAALARTERLSVGIGILPVPLRNPALAAMEVATLARLFPGRVRIGLGHGVQEWMGQVGARADSPMTLLREYVVAVRRLLAGERVTVEGRYVRLEGVQLGWPPQPPPPIAVGAVKPKTIALAGEVADGMVLSAESTEADVRAAVAGYDAARGERPGRVTAFVIGLTGPGAADRYAAELAHWQLDPARPYGVAGTPADLAAEVRRRVAAGAGAVMLQPTAEDDPVAYAETIGREVAPLVG